MSDLEQYNKCFSDNYNEFKVLAKSINNNYDYMGLLHTSYLLGLESIKRNGLKNRINIKNFIKVIIINRYKTEYRNKKQQIDIDCQDNQPEIESKLQLEEHQNQQDKESQTKRSYINTLLYEYVDQYYCEKDKFIFKTYYLLKHKHLNYKQLAEATGYSIATVSKIIKRIKKDLKINIECYILTGYRIMELQELQEQVKQLLGLSVEKNYQAYQEMHVKLYGTRWQGCGCQKRLLGEKIKTWLVKSVK